MTDSEHTQAPISTPRVEDDGRSADEMHRSLVVFIKACLIFACIVVGLQSRSLLSSSNQAAASGAATDVASPDFTPLFDGLNGWLIPESLGMILGIFAGILLARVAEWLLVTPIWRDERWPSGRDKPVANALP